MSRALLLALAASYDALADGLDPNKLQPPTSTFELRDLGDGVMFFGPLGALEHLPDGVTKDGAGLLREVARLCMEAVSHLKLSEAACANTRIQFR